ncbi:DMT family transporter [Acinetobacter sp. YH12052]|uniref:DMT family transporter n=1 Tax=Acinetobacter sp. YH12052 TaxID=2601055 RepID=UPI0035A02C0B
MEQRKALDAKASGLMIILCMILGIQQVILKLAAVDIAPIMQIAIRSGLAALLVFPLIRLKPGTHLYTREYLLPGIWLAFLFSAEFILVAESLRYTSASHTVVLLYTAPIFVALGLHWKLPEEKLTAIQWVGIFIAFSGIVLSFMGRESSTTVNTQALLGDAMALLAGVMWALTTISLRLTKLSDAPPTQTLFYQLVGGCVFLLPVAWLTGQMTVHWTVLSISSMIFHVLIISFFSLMLWFWLLSKYLANGLGVFSFLTPIFGLVFGVLILNETIELNFILGTALVMVGVMTVTLHRWLAKLMGRQRTAT